MKFSMMFMGEVNMIVVNIFVLLLWGYGVVNVLGFLIYCSYDWICWDGFNGWIYCVVEILFVECVIDDEMV